MKGHASLNRAYRLVWSEARQAWVAVQETARGRGKSTVRALATAALLCLAPAAFAQEKPATTVVPTGGNTNAYISPNGVPVVNIDTANAAGLSHNRYTRYDVERIGLVLNNGNTSQAARQSQLAGQVVANVNLAAEAKVILNEVVSTRRSSLAGFTEVLGGRADVVVANPNGITCSGCGFINTDRVTLTTGTPNIAASGALAGFTVNRGEVSVTGDGLNASAQQILDLVARTVKVDGHVNVPELGIAAGANRWSYTSREVTGAATPSGDAPAYAIDSSALGGMYAGRIRLIATEAGVGVRMLGEAAATADDFTLTAAGRIEVQGKVSAERDLALASSSAAADAIALADAELTARRNISLTATAGGANLSGGVLVAGTDLTGVLGSLSDSASAAAIDDNNLRYAGGDLALTVGGAAALDGVSYGAGSALEATVGSLAVGADGATVHAGTTLALAAGGGDLDLAAAALRAGGDLGLTATGAITTAAGAGQGVQSTGGDIALTAGDGITNAGTLSADAGDVTVRTDGLIDNRGTIHAAGTLDVADRSGGSGQDIDNAGTLLADGSLALKANAIVSSGGIQGTRGSAVAATSLVNSGVFVASDTAGQSGSFTLASLANSGTLQSAEDLELAVTATLANSGKLLAADDLAVSARQAGSTLAITNQAGGTMQAGDLLSIKGTAGAGNATLDNAGTVLGNALVLTLAAAQNAGYLQAGGGGATMDIAGLLDNDGTLLSDGSLAITAGSVDNAGGLQGTGGTTLGAATLTNSGTLIASNSAAAGSLTLGSLDNTGTLQSAADLNLAVTGTLSNGGTMLAGELLSLVGTATLANHGTVLGDTLALTLASASNTGYLQAGGGGATMGIAGLLDNDGTLLSDGALVIAAGSVDNAGGLQGTGGTTLGAATLTNSGTLIASNSAAAGSLTLGSLDNTGTLQSAADLNLAVTSTLSNGGLLLAIDDLAVSAASAGTTLAVTNHSGGTLQAGATLSLKGTAGGSNANLDNQDGSLIGDALELSLASLTNRDLIQGGSSTASTVAVTGTLTNHSDAKLLLATDASGGGTLAASTITNAGTLQSQGDLALAVGSALDNQGSGQVLAGGTLSVRGRSAASYTITDDGRLQAGGLLDIAGYDGGSAVGVTVGGILLGNTMAVNAGSLFVSNGAAVTSSGDMSLTLGSLSFGGSSARIVAATSGTGTATVALASGFSNVGAVHSSGSMSFSAPWITNTATGGFSALATLTVDATAGNLYNAGALYAGSQLNASASDTLTNVYGTGSIDSSGSMSLSAGSTFINNSAINAALDVAISAPTFRNEIPGGVPTRRWSAVAWGSDQLYDHYESGYYNEYWHYRAYGTRYQYFDGSIPSVKPQIIAGRNMSISGFSAAYNSGGVLAASNGTMTITGSGSFTNDDLSLVTENWKKQYYDWDDCGLFWLDCDSYYRVDYAEWVTGTSTAYSYGAGIFAGTLNASGFSLVNHGSPWAASPTSRSASGASGGALAAGASTTSASAGVSGTGATGTSSGLSGTSATSGASSISFGGLVITLPGNPNGYFVTSQDPAAGFLVETNPLFAVGSNFVGSNYLAQRYGYNPDTVQKRLGDANYEAYLIRQQLIDQTGNNLLKGYGDEAAQMQRLMDQAATQGRELGLTFGKTPSAAQLAGLKQDMVWMVETTVAGQKVLAPVVYLAADTRRMIKGGAVIAADDATLELESLSNEGGTIAGGNSLDIKSKGDITNLSGTIRGGDVSLRSATGSIRNETVTSGSGNDKQFATSIGKTAGIQATGALSLDAARDITVKGGDVSAGGDASLAAGGSVSFDTIVDKRTTSTMGRAGGLFSSGTTRNTTTTETNIGSNLASGGKLNIRSGGDTTIAGSTVKAGESLDVDAGGSFKVEARQDKVTSRTETEVSGIGVGGGMFGTEKTTTDSFKGSNKGSTIEVGGDATVRAAGEMVLQGSKMDVAGDADIDAKAGIKVLDGLDEERTRSTTVTTTFLKIDGDGGSTASEAGSESGAGQRKAGASAGASAEASSGNNFKLAETTTTTTDEGSRTSVASQLNVGGNLKAKTEGTLTIQGSEISAGGDAALEAKDVEVLTGRNEAWSDKTTTRTSVGFYEESGADASASAEASAKERGLATGASASAGAEANAESTVTIGVRTETEKESSYSLTNSASVIKAGGKLDIKAEEKASFVGAEVESGGDMNIEARDIENRAAQDIETSSYSRTRNTAGLYIGGEANAEAGAQASAKQSPLASSGAEAGAEASVEVSAGLREAYESENSTEGSVTNLTTRFKSGGNFKRSAENTIVDQGTQVEAAGDIEQSAREIRDEAIHDRSFSRADSQSHDARIGVYAGAEAGADSSGNAEASASAGLKASYEGEFGSENEASATAVTSKFKAGGGIKSRSTDGTTLVGTQFEAGGDVELEAGSLEYRAARDTSSSSSRSDSVNAEAKAAIYGDAGFSAEAGYGNESEGEASSTARTGSISAQNVRIRTTKGNASFEGTDIEAAGEAAIDSAGKVDFKAAYDTAESSASSAEVSAELSVGGGEVGAGLSGGYAQENESSRTAHTGGIKAGTISVEAKGDVDLEGTKLKSSGDTTIETDGDVNLKAARSSETSSAFGVSAGVEGGNDGSLSAGGATSAEYYKATEAEAAGTEAGGTLTIRGRSVTREAGGSSEISIGIEADGGVEREGKSRDD